MKATRLRAPSHDGGLLAEPPLDRAPSLAEANVDRLASWDHDFQGRKASWLRPFVRSQAIEAARGYLATIGVEPPAVPDEPSGLIVTGHQPEMYHPGVWIKNFAAAAIAARRGTAALNVIVDDDIPKSATIRVPHLKDGRLAVGRVEFDRWDTEAPYEDLPVHDEELFASFGDRVRGELGVLIPDPLIEEFWPEVARERESGLMLGLRLAAARRRIEESWGVSNLEVPFSRLCQSEGFYWFACHLLANLPRFQSVHNKALREYRTLYGIRSKNHPVSALKAEGEWLEAPFWVWRAGRPRRRSLMVRQGPKTMLLRIAGEDEAFIELPLAPDRDACCAVERLMDLPLTDVRLRTRALTTTMFSRYLLSDLFIHGIGGAKYDELGDAIAHRFFGIEPPSFLTLSLTSWLGLPQSSASAATLAALDRESRVLEYNPDQRLGDHLDLEQIRLVEEKARLIAEEPEAHRARKERFRRIRAVNEALHPAVAERAQQLRDERTTIVREVEENRLARSREYAVVLHSSERLRQVMMGVVETLAQPVAEPSDS